MIGLFRCKSDLYIHLFFLEILRENCSWSTKLNAHAYGLLIRTVSNEAAEPTTSRLIKCCCKLQVQPKCSVGFVSLILLWRNPLATQSTTLAKTSNANLIINQQKDPQNPDATISKYFKKQLGSLCK